VVTGLSKEKQSPGLIVWGGGGGPGGGGGGGGHSVCDVVGGLAKREKILSMLGMGRRLFWSSSI